MWLVLEEQGEEEEEEQETGSEEPSTVRIFTLMEGWRGGHHLTYV